MLGRRIAAMIIAGSLLTATACSSDSIRGQGRTDEPASTTNRDGASTSTSPGDPTRRTGR
jgi:hypothetical protein